MSANHLYAKIVIHSYLVTVSSPLKQKHYLVSNIFLIHSCIGTKQPNVSMSLCFFLTLPISVVYRALTQNFRCLFLIGCFLL